MSVPTEVNAHVRAVAQKKEWWAPGKGWERSEFTRCRGNRISRGKRISRRVTNSCKACGDP